MQVKDNQVFNLMDTNGRRQDVISALQTYLEILKDITPRMEWKHLPDSLAQFTFYKRAKEAAPEVFKRNNGYDTFIENLKQTPKLQNAMYKGDIDYVQSVYDEHKEDLFNGDFDVSIESRARHYTSTLVKLGFIDKDRNITEIGRLLLNPSEVIRDEFEKLLPIDNVNLIYARQLLKLRVYNKANGNYYSPFCMALYLLLEDGKIDEKKFLSMVQGYDFFSDSNSPADIAKSVSNEILYTLHNSDITKEEFKKVFRNGKSSETIETYWGFYKKLKECIENPSYISIGSMLAYYKQDEIRGKIDKAFGKKNKLFDTTNNDIKSPEGFKEAYPDFFNGDKLLVVLYNKYFDSIALNQEKENSDTTRRIFKASGLISFNNKIVELAYPKICKHIFDKNTIINLIAGRRTDSDYVSFDDYETIPDNYYSQPVSLIDILKFNSLDVSRIRDLLKKEYGKTDINQIPQIAADEREEGFRTFIEEKYPVETVKEILGMFKDRNNDEQIKKRVCSEATVPTICEYMTGIAWYYFSGKSIKLLNSFNLSLTADYEPMTHAAGGQGDIVIRDPKNVVMLEVTLMDPNSQKRGEWEPVLRHSANLKAQEESENTNKDVTTFFVADEFDSNSINIWKAVSSVPLQSTRDRDVFTDCVVIMPLKFDELALLMDKSDEYNEIIAKTQDLFKADQHGFNINWRKEFMQKIL